MCVFCVFVWFCAVFDQPSLRDSMCGEVGQKPHKTHKNAHFLTKYKKKIILKI